MKVIEVKNLKKKFGNFTALHDVHLDVNQGEVYGFIGPNGAGKTTTIRILLGILKADEGMIKVLNQDSWDDAVSIHQKVAFVPGEVNLWSNLTGGEVIDLFMNLRGFKDEAQKDRLMKKRDELIERFDLDPTKKCGSYSKGNRQKVALISAFASDCELFVLDEPTSGLDPLMERVFQEYVFEAKEAGKTILLSSHILSEVERLCDRISIIREGKIIESGTLDELRHLTRMSIKLKTKDEIPQLNELDGVHDVLEDNQGLTLQVEPDKLGDLMKYVSQYDVLKFESSLPTLEELFMRHYEGDDPTDVQ